MVKLRRMQALGESENWHTGQGVDPNSSLTNLSDCMLVLALGLMLVLVVAWNAEIPTMEEVEVTSMEEIENPEIIFDTETLSGEGYIDMGRVWQDPKTGKLYLLTQDDSLIDLEADEGEADAGELTTSQTSPNSLGAQGSDTGELDSTEAGEG